MNDIMNLTQKSKPTKSSLNRLAGQLTEQQKNRLLKFNKKEITK